MGGGIPTLLHLTQSQPRTIPEVLRHAGIDPTLPPAVVREWLRTAIAARGGECWWSLDQTGWVVTLVLPEEQVFADTTLEAALAACLAWLTGCALPSER
jgi:hypothetical protein